MNSQRIRLPKPADSLQSFACYRGGQEKLPVDLKLDSNEGLSPSVDLAVELIPKATNWNRYPDASRLEALLAKRHGVSPAQVLVTAGADEALDRICRAYLQAGRNAVCHWPSFEMLPRYVALANGDLHRVLWKQGEFPLSELAAAKRANTSLLFLVSPNNPTGLAVGATEVQTLARACSGCLLVVDQAYAEFDNVDLAPVALAEPNTILLRSFSKAWGLAGLRVGYAIADAEVIVNLRKAGGPYSVAAPSLALVESCLEHAEEWLARSVPRVQRERNELTTTLRRHGFQVAESRANFVLASGETTEWLRRGLGSLGISVRGFDADPELRDSVRITCPASEEDFACLQTAIETCLSPQTILFDLDGVIADVSQSYRLAIMETARCWGLMLSTDEISAAKAEADSNNDWLLTHRLICASGECPSLPEVTERFEKFYQGTENRVGLRDRECLAVSTELLQDFASRMPLAVITGRPRKDAEHFLETMGVRPFFQEVLCMEDGPAKPNPSIVRSALGRLGVTRAWLLGDFPDDLAAARGAGVLPIGVIAPGSNPSQSKACLLRAGAAVVLSQTNDLRELLR